VLEAVSPARPVHLLAHDWGSIQGWHFVTSADLSGRIASFTSISGPSLHHLGPWVRANLRPSPAKFSKGLRQLAHWYYIGFFQLPVLPELFWRSGVGNRLLGKQVRGYFRSTADRTNGLALYRANMLPGLSPRQVQFEAPKPFASNLYLRSIAGGHWIVNTQPDVIARAATEPIEQVESGTGSSHSPVLARPHNDTASTPGSSASDRCTTSGSPRYPWSAKSLLK
jgi:hypothetical protein